MNPPLCATPAAPSAAAPALSQTPPWTWSSSRAQKHRNTHPGAFLAVLFFGANGYWLINYFVDFYVLSIVHGQLRMKHTF